ncbi:MAG: helix-turn-helix domain-containing protein [Acidobacteriota bacterium]
MSIGKTILQMRLRAGKTQCEIASETGLAVSYLSRLENNHINPSVRTLSKLALVLGVPVTSFFDGEPSLESGDRCPVSPSGRCILDQLFVARGRKPQRQRESYSRKHLETLQLCNFLLHTGDHDITSALSTMMRSMLALAASKDKEQLVSVVKHLTKSNPHFP